jgi:hypothetical protein
VAVFGQSATCAQPHCPPPVAATHAPPLGLCAQLAHRPPFDPHAAGCAPGWQVPPVAAEQHPPLHGRLASQAAPHACASGSQAWPAGQSTELMQPHWLDGPAARQACPDALCAQVPHNAPPPSAHALAAVPSTHFICVPSQQPPLQGELAPHVTPHAPAAQAWPSGHAAHAAPDEPQRAVSLPAAHDPLSQQPPLQGWLGPHAVEHSPWLVSHAWPDGQSPLVAQRIAASRAASIAESAAASHAPSRDATRRSARASIDAPSGDGATGLVPQPPIASTKTSPRARIGARSSKRRASARRGNHLRFVDWAVGAQPTQCRHSVNRARRSEA